MPTTPPDTPVIIIQSLQSDLYALKAIPHVSIRNIDELNPDTLQSIIRDPITKHSFIILEKEAFEGYETPMRGFIRHIRRSHGSDPHILVLRCKSMGRDNPMLTDGDKAAGANAVLWYQLSLSAKELTRQIHRFIRNPSINFSEQGAPRTERPSSRFGMKEKPHSQRKGAPKKRERTEETAPKSKEIALPSSWLAWPFGNTQKQSLLAPPAPTRTREVAILTEIPEKRRATVTFGDKTLELRKSIAITLVALINEPTEISQRDLMKKIGVTTRQPVYERIERLKNDLDTHSPGLGSCIIRTERESGRNQPLPVYRFDHDIWCSVLGIK